MRICVILFICAIFFSFTTIAFAHGGFEKRSGDIAVYILQTPISPLVGEKVEIYFTLKDDSIKSNDLSDKNLVDFPVILSVIDTYYGDATKDKIILKKQMRTDANGSFAFEYTFNKENYFDIDLDFVDKKGEKREVGFLIQPRKSGTIITSVKNLQISEFFLSLSAGVILGVLGLKAFRIYYKR